MGARFSWCAAALAVACGSSSHGPGSDDVCNAVSPCANDPAADPAGSSLCEAWRADPTCGGAFETFARCQYAGIMCDADGKSPAGTRPACAPAYDAWDGCRTSAAGGGGSQALGSPCTSASDCASNDCESFGEKGLRCSQPCATNADCPNPPRLGCNTSGACVP